MALLVGNQLCDVKYQNKHVLASDINMYDIMCLFVSSKCQDSVHM